MMCYHNCNKPAINETQKRRRHEKYTSCNLIFLAQNSKTSIELICWLFALPISGSFNYTALKEKSFEDLFFF